VSNRWPGKIVIGLTGNIATGKSLVRRMLEHLGAFGIDADGLAHRAMSPGAPAYQPIVDTFGRWILTPDWQIDREKLGKIVFTDPDAMARLEAIVHPIVLEVIDLLVRRAKQRVIAIEAIKLFESGIAKDCDTIWVVDAPPDVQLRRLMRDRKLSEADARMRIAAQAPQSDKLARAQVIINNTGGYEATLEQVQRHLNALLGVKEAPPEPAPQVTTVSLPGEAAITIQRGGPKQAEMIAAFLNKMQGGSLTRTNVIDRFGQKAYMMALANDQLVGLAGLQVENLIARVDEFLLLPGAPANTVVRGLMESIEKAASDLQAEIALVFLANNTPEPVSKAIEALDYERRTPADLGRVPDWRQAAEESMPPNSYLLTKRLREDRVLKPI
jgi:dephospho-CoA kinase